MVLSIFSKKSIDVNKFSKNVIKSNVYSFVVNVLLKIYPDWAETKLTGEIDNDLLRNFIDLSADNPRYNRIVYTIIDTKLSDNIPDDLFDRIVNFHDYETRLNLIISLSHKSLSEKQLIYLCNIGMTFECFFELATLYYTDMSFSDRTLLRFLKSFQLTKYSEMYKELLLELQNRYVASDALKETLVDDLLKEMVVRPNTEDDSVCLKESNTGDGSVY